MQETTNRYIEGYQQGYQSGYEKGWLDAKNRLSPNDPRYFVEKGEHPRLNSNGTSQPLLIWTTWLPDQPFLGYAVKKSCPDKAKMGCDTEVHFYRQDLPGMYFELDVFAWIPAPPEM